MIVHSPEDYGDFGIVAGFWKVSFQWRRDAKSLIDPLQIIFNLTALPGDIPSHEL